jgi:FG-GAP-like repeat
MKMHIRLHKALIHAAIALITTAVASTSRADNLTAFGDFDNDGLVDVAAITSSTTVTVYLANPDGSYTVSATLSAPGNKKITFVQLFDFNGDGALDVIANGPASGVGSPATYCLGTGTAPSAQ